MLSLSLVILAEDIDLDEVENDMLAVGSGSY
jgi:hypothetical protein